MNLANRGEFHFEGGRALASGPARWAAALGAGLLALAALGNASSARADDQSDAQALVEKARSTVQTFAQDPDMAALKAALGQAKAVLVFPQVLRAGFFIGGSGGNGVLLVRDSATGAWRGPAFYTMGAASLGLQAGATSAEVMLLVNSQKTLDALYTNKLKLGAEASVALGSKSREQTATVNADFLVFAKVQGLFAGVTVEGAVLDARQTLNAAYYGKPATPVDILVRKTVTRADAAPLHEALSAAAP